jgi:hypothetical protein
MITYRRIISYTVVAWHFVIRYDYVIKSLYTGIETTIITIAATTNYDPQRQLQQPKQKMDFLLSYEISCVLYLNGCNNG